MSYLTSSATVQKDILPQQVDGAFLRIESEKPGDIPEEYEAELTQGEMVDIFASIFGRGSCGAADAPGAYTGPEPGEMPQQSATNYLQVKYPGRDGAQQLASEFGAGAVCLPETLDGGEVSKDIYVHASSQKIFDKYELVSHDAKLDGLRYVNADIYLKIEFSNTPTAPIYYYVDKKRLSEYLSLGIDRSDVYEWRGVIKDADGNTVDNPTWTYKNGAIHFPGNWSGILVFKRLPIHYHIYTLTIKGTVDAEATRHYDARVSGKAPGLSIVHKGITEEVTADNTVKECPWLDLEKFLSPTSGKYNVTCENCGSEDDLPETPPEEPPACKDKITKAEYSERCCGGPLPGCLPGCLKTETTVQGPVGGTDGAETGIVLMPEDGTPCGTLTTTYTGGDGGCCDNVDAIKFSEENTEVVTENGSVSLAFLGGKPPFTVTIEGDGFYLTPGGAKEIETNFNSFPVYANESCGSADISVTDDCGNTDDTSLRSTNGEWVEIDRWGVFDGSGGIVADCINKKTRTYEDYCGRFGPCPDTCTGEESFVCEPPPYEGTICTVEGRITYEWQCVQS